MVHHMATLKAVVSKFLCMDIKSVPFVMYEADITSALRVSHINDLAD
jgi:hypothetical protein